MATDQGPCSVGAVNQTAFCSANQAPLGAWIKGVGEFETYLSDVLSMGCTSGGPGNCGVNVALTRSTCAVCGICVAISASFACTVPAIEALTFSLGLSLGICANAAGRSLAA